MYEFIDRPVTALSQDGRFLLWSMRQWTNSVMQGHCPSHALERAFTDYHALCVLQPFHQSLSLLARKAQEKLLMGPIFCGNITEHEALLLALWRDVGIGRHDNVHKTLSHVVPADTVATIAQAMARAGAAMSTAGFGISLIKPQNIKD